METALIREAAAGGAVRSEVLGYLEGFMTAFHLEPAPHTVSLLELQTAGEKWALMGDDSVKSAALGRLRQYASTLDPKHRTVLTNWVDATLTSVTAKPADEGQRATQAAKQDILPFLRLVKQTLGAK